MRDVKVWRACVQIVKEGWREGKKAISDVRDLMAQESGNVTDVVKMHVLWRREEASS